MFAVRIGNQLNQTECFVLELSIRIHEVKDSRNPQVRLVEALGD
jgi:hypothetical protein